MSTSAESVEPYFGRAIVTLEVEGDYGQEELDGLIDELRSVTHPWRLTTRETEVTGGPVGEATDYVVDSEGNVVPA